MESTGNLQHSEARRGETHGFGNGHGDMGHPLLMVNRIRVPGSDGCFHNLDDSLHEPFLPAATLKPLADPRFLAILIGFEKRIGLKRIPDNKGFPDFDSENPDFQAAHH
jgi:hypothetical protein